jgi:hypothetical protein
VDWAEDFEGDLTRDLIIASACLTTSLVETVGINRLNCGVKVKLSLCLITHYAMKNGRKVQRPTIS